MIARLAFSTATDETADILLIDEVLSVGDSEFQEKSKERIMTMIGNGAAVVLVSHSPGTVKELADRAIWLEDGKVKMDGPAALVADAYEAH
jgi:ABC-type polysaccharide/polyol phosphate transport system ATPase subunit